jgi:hypothetical protein
MGRPATFEFKRLAYDAIASGGRTKDDGLS